MTERPPGGFLEEVERPSQGRIRAIYRGNVLVGYQDPDLVVRRFRPDGSQILLRNLFAPGSVARERVVYDFDRQRLLDSFGRPVTVASLRLPGGGISVARRLVDVEYQRLGVDPRQFRPSGNQEIVERVTFVGRDGKLRTLDTSYGLGERYDRSRFGGRWRNAASESLGLRAGERAPTRDLQRAVLSREFIVKSIVPRGG